MRVVLLLLLLCLLYADGESRSELSIDSRIESRALRRASSPSSSSSSATAPYSPGFLSRHTAAATAPATGCVGAAIVCDPSNVAESVGERKSDANEAGSGSFFSAVATLPVFFSVLAAFALLAALVVTRGSSDATEGSGTGSGKRVTISVPAGTAITAGSVSKRTSATMNGTGGGAAAVIPAVVIATGTGPERVETPPAPSQSIMGRLCPCFFGSGRGGPVASYGGGVRSGSERNLRGSVVKNPLGAAAAGRHSSGGSAGKVGRNDGSPTASSKLPRPVAPPGSISGKEFLDRRKRANAAAATATTTKTADFATIQALTKEALASRASSSPASSSTSAHAAPLGGSDTGRAGASISAANPLSILKAPALPPPPSMAGMTSGAGILPAAVGGSSSNSSSSSSSGSTGAARASSSPAAIGGAGKSSPSSSSSSSSSPSRSRTPVVIVVDARGVKSVKKRIGAKLPHGALVSLSSATASSSTTSSASASSSTPSSVSASSSSLGGASAPTVAASLPLLPPKLPLPSSSTSSGNSQSASLSLLPPPPPPLLAVAKSSAAEANGRPPQGSSPSTGPLSSGQRNVHFCRVHGMDDDEGLRRQPFF